MFSCFSLGHPFLVATTLFIALSLSLCTLISTKPFAFREANSILAFRQAADAFGLADQSSLRPRLQILV